MFASDILTFLDLADRAAKKAVRCDSLAITGLVLKDADAYRSEPESITKEAFDEANENYQKVFNEKNFLKDHKQPWAKTWNGIWKNGGDLLKQATSIRTDLMKFQNDFFDSANKLPATGRQMISQMVELRTEEFGNFQNIDINECFWGHIKSLTHGLDSAKLKLVNPSMERLKRANTDGTMARTAELTELKPKADTILAELSAIKELTSVSEITPGYEKAFEYYRQIGSEIESYLITHSNRRKLLAREDESMDALNLFFLSSTDGAVGKVAAQAN